MAHNQYYPQDHPRQQYFQHNPAARPRSSQEYPQQSFPQQSYPQHSQPAQAYYPGQRPPPSPQPPSSSYTHAIPQQQYRPPPSPQPSLAQRPPPSPQPQFAHRPPPSPQPVPQSSFPNRAQLPQQALPQSSFPNRQSQPPPQSSFPRRPQSQQFYPQSSFGNAPPSSSFGNQPSSNYPAHSFPNRPPPSPQPQHSFSQRPPSGPPTPSHEPTTASPTPHYAYLPQPSVFGDFPEPPRSTSPGGRPLPAPRGRPESMPPPPRSPMPTSSHAVVRQPSMSPSRSSPTRSPYPGAPQSLHRPTSSASPPKPAAMSRFPTQPSSPSSQGRPLPTPIPRAGKSQSLDMRNMSIRTPSPQKGYNPPMPPAHEEPPMTPPKHPMSNSSVVRRIDLPPAASPGQPFVPHWKRNMPGSQIAAGSAREVVDMQRRGTVSGVISAAPVNRNSPQANGRPLPFSPTTTPAPPVRSEPVWEDDNRSEAQTPSPQYGILDLPRSRPPDRVEAKPERRIMNGVRGQPVRSNTAPQAPISVTLQMASMSINNNPSKQTSAQPSAGWPTNLPRLPRAPGSPTKGKGRMIDLDDAPPPSLRRSPSPSAHSRSPSVPAAPTHIHQQSQFGNNPNTRPQSGIFQPTPFTSGQNGHIRQPSVPSAQQQPQASNGHNVRPPPAAQQHQHHSHPPSPRAKIQHHPPPPSPRSNIQPRPPVTRAPSHERTSIPKISFPADPREADSESDEDSGPMISISVADMDGPQINVTPAVPSINVENVNVNANPARAKPVAPLPSIRRTGGLSCGGCGGAIIGRIVSAIGVRWHPACFKCCVCDELLENLSSYEKDGRPYCHLDYHDAYAPKCYHCGTTIVDEQFITLDDHELGTRTYHEQHFFCAECGDPFLPMSSGNRSFAGDGMFEDDDVGFTVYKGHPYCESCHVRLRMPKCKKCNKSIRDGMKAVEALGSKWCWECFVCAGCDKPFENPSFFQRDNYPFCERCFSILIRNEM